MAKNIEIVGTAEIAEMFGVTKQVVTNWRVRYKDFPKPLATLSMGSIFSKKDVQGWGKATGKI